MVWYVVLWYVGGAHAFLQHKQQVHLCVGRVKRVGKAGRINRVSNYLAVSLCEFKEGHKRVIKGF
jgi:hypothetical protein